MKALIKSIPLFFFHALVAGCSENLDIYRETDYLPVIYSVFCPDDSTISVKVERSYQGNQSAYVSAKNPDSAFLSSLNVSLDLIHAYRRILWAHQDIPLVLRPDRETGLFYESPNYVFMSNTGDIFATSTTHDGGLLRLTIYDPSLDRYSVGESVLLPKPEILGPRTVSGTFRAAFYSRDPFVVSYNNTGAAYEIKIVFHYSEFGNDNQQVDDSITWQMAVPYLEDPTLSSSSPKPEDFIIEGSDFFREIGKRIPVKPNVSRLFTSFSVILISVDPILRIYEEQYHAITDIDPGLTSNIANGLGFFACARKSEVAGLLMDQRSLDSLSDGSFTRKLSFKRW